MAVGMMNGPVWGPEPAAVSLPRLLIAKVAARCSGFSAAAAVAQRAGRGLVSQRPRHPIYNAAQIAASKGKINRVYTNALLNHS